MAMHRIGVGQIAQQAAAWATAALERGIAHPRTLIASADQSLAQQLAAMLCLQDHEVMLAYDRGLALRLAVWELPDLFILDAQLAGDGIALCASLKRDRRTSGIRIIIATQACDRAEQLHCAEAGADDYCCWTDAQQLATRSSQLLKDKLRDETLARLDRIAAALDPAAVAKNALSSEGDQEVWNRQEQRVLLGEPGLARVLVAG